MDNWFSNAGEQKDANALRSQYNRFCLTNQDLIRRSSDIGEYGTEAQATARGISMSANCEELTGNSSAGEVAGRRIGIACLPKGIASRGS